MTLTFTEDAVVVLAGLPGAGKSTLIRRAVDRRAAAVVDTDDQRAAGRRRLLNTVHYFRIATAIASIAVLDRPQAARIRTIDFGRPAA